VTAQGLFVSDKWKEYELIDCGDHKRLERWGEIILIRPDPQALWPTGDHPLWEKPDAVYHRSSGGGGRWEYIRNMPSDWIVKYRDISFKVSPTGFKHTGLFPEQAYNWDIIRKLLKGRSGNSVLNLFGYTGAASVAAAKSGAEVCHVDSSKGMLNWTKENAALSGVEGHIRLIPDDCLNFAKREEKRGKRYDAIIMDPPSFGRGGKGEVWKLEDDFWRLLLVCARLLSDTPLFLLINSYTAGISPLVAANMARSLDLQEFVLSYGELALPFRSDSFRNKTGGEKNNKGKMFLPCGITLCAEFTHDKNACSSSTFQ
jgi:23S rRNA (cytosine1962-C5)-methyltransferase